ncbi:SDR family oxidoreductase [Chelatococcus sp. SYSU_G07232]|uniref:SDR family oxidoreductase n=1 Tax=Chelatococcus albus TaxID=3047466 RepID=A0ABT7AKS8_9HYPH|nr:SDR family oxidoreductase [Chelatococcus sp. SYSU_G07232]MDJ1159965.1 SDR family oxidoreductase [Chelatococcus sp. SYSU_G07232]
MRFSGKTVLVTGAGGGIGRALVAHFTGEGARIIAHDRSEEALAPVAGAHRPAILAWSDLCDAEATRQTITAAVERAGGLDILVNNAGAAAAKTLGSMTVAAFHRDIDLNLKGTYHVVEAALPALKARPGTAIVNIGTVNALGSYGHPAYAAAKAGLVSLTKSMAVELGRYGIRVNIVCPGTVRTPAWNDRIALDPAVFDEVKRWYPLGRVAEPEEIARVVAFLASDDAAVVTGAVLPADCGLTAGQPPLVQAFTYEQV